MKMNYKKKNDYMVHDTQGKILIIACFIFSDFKVEQDKNNILNGLKRNEEKDI